MIKHLELEYPYLVIRTSNHLLPSFSFSEYYLCSVSAAGFHIARRINGGNVAIFEIIIQCILRGYYFSVMQIKLWLRREQYANSQQRELVDFYICGKDRRKSEYKIKICRIQTSCKNVALSRHFLNLFSVEPFSYGT